MRHVRRPKKRGLEIKPDPRIRLGGRTMQFVDHALSQRQQMKEELARIRANFITYLYEHSEPI